MVYRLGLRMLRMLRLLSLLLVLLVLLMLKRYVAVVVHHLAGGVVARVGSIR